AFAQALAHLDPAAVGIAEFERDARSLAIADREHRRFTAILEQRAARHHQGILALVVTDRQAAEHAGLQVAFALERRHHAERAAAGIHRRRHALHRAGE